MKESEKNTKKRMYNSPEIIYIKLDNEIALVLESTPPEGPGEGASLAPRYMNNNPFRFNLD